MSLQGPLRSHTEALSIKSVAFQLLGDNPSHDHLGAKDVSFQPPSADILLKPCALKKFLPSRSISGIVRAGLLAGLKNQAVQILRVQLRLHVR